MKKIAAALLIACTLALAACGGRDGPPAISIEFNGRTTSFSANIYSYYLSYVKTRELMGVFSMLGATNPAEMHQFYVNLPNVMPDFWNDETIYMLQMQAEMHMAQILAIVAFCREHNLTLSSQQRNDIDAYIRDVIQNVFGRSRSAFNATLGRFGIDEDIFRDIKRYEAMLGLMHRHLFNEETGTRRVTDAMIMEVYEEIFARFNHILILGDNVPGLELTEEELAERRQRALEIYEQVRAGDRELFEELMISETEDAWQAHHGHLEQGFTITEDGMFHENLTEALFDMQVGEVRLVETDMGFHVMKRYELLPPHLAADLTSPGDTIAQTLTRGFQGVIVREELTPFMENLTLHHDEIGPLNVRTSDVMFDVWAWIN